MRTTLALCLMVIMPGLSSRANAVQERDTALTALAAAFIAAVNDTTQPGRLAALPQIYAAATTRDIGEERLIGLLGKLHRDYGVLTFHHAEQTGTYLHIFAQAKTDNAWHDFQFSLSADPAPRLLNIVFIADVAEPVYLPNGSIDNAFTLTWLNTYIDRLRTDNDLAGAVLIARGDSVLYERYVGFADAARRRPVSASTRFNLASGNKMFTALAILQLQEAGKLTLDDSIASFLPAYPDQAFARRATLHHLLSHTSGLGDFLDEISGRAGDTITELSQMLPFVVNDSLAFPVGTGFQYSNSGFILAGLAVERASGTDYFTYVREHICEPLGMRHTDSYHHDRTDLDLAERLTKAENGWRAVGGIGRGSSAGGGYSTARDMLLFARGLVGGRVVAPGSLKTMTEPKNIGLEDTYPYGYGFTLNVKRNRLVSFGHGGIAPGVNFELQYYPDDDITLVMFCNQDNGAYDDLRKNLVKLITGDR